MNKSLFKIHSTLALFAFIPLMVICITGSLLVFKHEIDRLLMNDKVRVAPQAERLRLDSLLERVNIAYPSYEVVGWVQYLDEGRADQVYVMERGTNEWSFVHLNPYNGALLSMPVPHDHYFTDWLLGLHYTLLLHDAGTAITALFSIVLLILGITGLILHRRFWKNFFTLRWNSRLVVYFSDLHKMVGVVSSPILIILAFTGAWWNIAALLHEYEEHADGHEHPVMERRLYNDKLSLDTLLQASKNRIAGFRATYITLPYEPGVNIAFWGDVPTNNILASPYASVVSFDPKSGELLSASDIRQSGMGAQIVDSYERLHFGDFAGLFFRIIWAIIGLAPLLLAVTGVTLWWKRRHQRRRARNKKQNAAKKQQEKMVLTVSSNR